MSYVRPIGSPSRFVTCAKVAGKKWVYEACMNTLTSLTREALIKNTQALVAEEKRLELELLDHLREVDRRLLHLEMGYASLFEFAVKFLDLSEASAYRRIAAMKLVREIPEIKTALVSGSLTLTNVAAAHTFFRSEKKLGNKRSADEKKTVLKQIEGLSKKECERKLLEISPETLPKEKERALTLELTELKLVLDSETMAMIEELKGHLAHALPNATAGDLIKRALSETLTRVRNARTPKFAPEKATCVTPPVTPAKLQRLSAAETRRQIFSRAQQRCEYVGHKGERCSYTYGLEIDHIQPRAMGGADEAANYRVLCKQHNGFEAAQLLGHAVMQPYLPSLQSSFS